MQSSKRLDEFPTSDISSTSIHAGEVVAVDKAEGEPTAAYTAPFSAAHAQTTSRPQEICVKRRLPKKINKSLNIYIICNLKDMLITNRLIIIKYLYIKIILL